VLAHAIAGAFDVHDHGVVEQPAQQSRGNDEIAEHLAPLAKAVVGGQDHGAVFVAGVDRLKEQVLSCTRLPTKGYSIGRASIRCTLRCLYRAKAATLPQRLVTIRRHDANFSRDQLRNLIDEVAALQFPHAHHKEAQPFHAIIDDEIDRRRIMAAEGAFAEKDHAWCDNSWPTCSRGTDQLGCVSRRSARRCPIRLVSV